MSQPVYHLHAEAKADALLVTALDEVAWALNLRGRDVPYNPIFVAYVIVTKDAASLYVDASKARVLASGSRSIRLCAVLAITWHAQWLFFVDLDAHALLVICASQNAR